MSMILYDYYRSSTSYRVRIALHFKGLAFTRKPIHLVKNGGEQFSAEYSSINPEQKVPLLALADGQHIAQSLTIIDYLERHFPTPALLPAESSLRTLSLRLSHIIACDMHAINNARVLRYLREQLGQDDAAVQRWYQHWVAQDLTAFERILAANDAGYYCVGDQFTLADACLLPQCYNARRFACDMTPYPHITRIEEHALTLPFVQQAHPDANVDA